MNYEEKYKLALERAKYALDTDMDDSGHWAVNYIFPELKESEGERIRKEIVDFITSSNKYGTNERCEAWLNWLEKQSEKDPYIGCTNDKGCITCENGNLKEIKIEQKFKVGDWIANGGANPCYVKSIFGDYYELCSCEGFEYTKPIIDVNYTYHLWTIQDAKDGDVLAYATDEGDSWIMIYRSLYEPYEGHVHYHALLVNDNFSDKGTCCICIDNLKPATKEQRDLLFQKMKEAGYEWDAEKKELKKVEPKMLDADKVIEWMKTHGNLFPIVTIRINDVIAKFKKDFGLC